MPKSSPPCPSQPASFHSESCLVFHAIPTLATRFGVSERSVRRLINRGELAAHKIGGQIRISEHDVQSFLKSNLLVKKVRQVKR